MKPSLVLKAGLLLMCLAAPPTTLITGMYATTLDIQHHRSSVAIPDKFKLDCETLHDAGYYCTNNSKKDYSIAGKQGGWDVSSDKAHYRNRRPGQPFFAIFNLMDDFHPLPGCASGVA